MELPLEEIFKSEGNEETIDLDTVIKKEKRTAYEGGFYIKGTVHSLVRVYREAQNKVRGNLFRNFRGRYFISQLNKEPDSVLVVKDFTKLAKNKIFEVVVAKVKIIEEKTCANKLNE